MVVDIKHLISRTKYEYIRSKLRTNIFRFCPWHHFFDTQDEKANILVILGQTLNLFEVNKNNINFEKNDVQCAQG